MTEKFSPLSDRAPKRSTARNAFAFAEGSDHKFFKSLLLSSAFLLVFLCAQPKAFGQVTILHNFGDGTVINDGHYPSTGLVQASDGNFYGSGVITGTTKQPAVYQMTTASTVTLVKLFARNVVLPAFYPLLDYKGKLIGIAYTNGSVATLYALTESAKGTWSRTNWYTFSTSSAGIGPRGTPILGANGDLYGVTLYGGKNGGGTAYKVNPTTHSLTFFSNFPSRAPAANPVTSLLSAADGNFYGGTLASINSSGEIFKMTPAGKLSTFYTFTGTPGLNGPLIQGTDGNFYGATGNTLFKLTPGASFSVLHTFGLGTDGAGPGSVTQGSNGNLYGLCSVGGTAGYGTIFEISTDGSSYTVLHNFGDGSIQNDGQYPQDRLLLGGDKNFYGVTQSGGSAGYGTIFRVSP